MNARKEKNWGVTIAVLAGGTDRGQALQARLSDEFAAQTVQASAAGAWRPVDILVLEGDCEEGALGVVLGALDGVWSKAVLVYLEAANPGAVSTALRFRAQYVLTHRAALGDIVAIVGAAGELCAANRTLGDEVRMRSSAIGRICSAEFELRTLEEAKNLATMLSLSCPNSDDVAVGLSELLINAIEHGNLGVSNDEKMELLLSGRWLDEIEDRLQRAPYRDRHVRVRFQRDGAVRRFHIVDEGEGFDAAPYTNRDISASRQLNGRGIWLARTIAFDTLEYKGRGNEVLCTVAGDENTTRQALAPASSSSERAAAC